jgi:hypothetical protein
MSKHNRERRKRRSLPRKRYLPEQRPSMPITLHSQDGSTTVVDLLDMIGLVFEEEDDPEQQTKLN